LDVKSREGARRLHEHGVFARFRYNDLKEAARGCGGRAVYKFNGVKEQRRTDRFRMALSGSLGS